MRYTLAIGAALLAGACAKSPESIAPAYVSHVSYQSWTCQQLQEEGARLQHALVIASEQQRNARTNDTVGVIFLGLPVSSLSGDNIAPQVANPQRPAQAVQTASNLRNCGFTVAMPATPPSKPVEQKSAATFSPH
jgi:hypothetical protein